MFHYVCLAIAKLAAVIRHKLLSYTSWLYALVVHSDQFWLTKVGPSGQGCMWLTKFGPD